MKKYLKIFLCFLLSVITAFSALPTPALADDVVITEDNILKVSYYYTRSNGDVHTDFYDLAFTDDTSTISLLKSSVYGYYWSKYKYVTFYTPYCKLEGKGTVSYSIVLNTNRKLDSITFGSYDVQIYKKNGSSSTALDTSFSYTLNNRKIVITATTQDVCNNGDYKLYVHFSNPLYGTEVEDDSAFDLFLSIPSIEPSFATKSDSFFDGIFGFLSERFEGLNNLLNSVILGLKNVSTSINEYIQKVIDKFKDITDSIKNNIASMTNDINGFFISLKKHLTDLVDKIKVFFIDLGNQITAFAMSVKEWFSDLFTKLGDWFSSVGQWFKDLWTNISNKVIEIKTDIQEWFESLFVVGDDFWQEYRDNFNTFMVEHFGFLYQSMDIISTILVNFKEVLTGDGSGSIIIPKIAIPAKVFGTEHVIIKSRQYNLNNTLKLDDTGKLNYILTSLRVINSALIIMLLINRGRKLFDMIITQGEGVEE